MTGKVRDIDDFGPWLRKAILVEEDQDWTPHTVDYNLFKSRLKFFARRRSRLRSMMNESSDGRVNQTVLQTMLQIGPNSRDASPFASPPPRSITVNSYHINQSATSATIGAEKALRCEASSSGEDDEDDHGEHPYIRFVDLTKSPSEASSLGTHTKGRIIKRSVLRQVSNLERQEMANFLRWEADKAALFYLAHWQKISRKLDNSSVDPIVGDEILELFAFCAINIVVMCQILIRYDAYARAFEGTPMMDYYLKKITKRSTSFRKILRHDELAVISDLYVQLSPNTNHHDVLQFVSQRSMFQNIIACSAKAYNGGPDLTNSFVLKLREWFLLGGLLEDRLGLEPAYLTMRGQSLTNEIKQLADWRTMKLNILPIAPTKRLTAMQVFHLTLNLISAFLYCMNYYIVEPSSTMYVNRLGAHDAMSGTLIGMMPLAAFASSLPYSIWTNRSFRQPFIASGVLLICGNLLYSMADRFQRIDIALAGRFIAGLGAPKCIIRRYMADTTPLALRTSVNAGFGMVVAAGSAMGPAMAVMLNRIEYTVAFPYIGVISLNGLTLPGYFMASLWLTFTVIVLLTFEEPDREGLEEQKLLESHGDILVSPTNRSTTDNSTSYRNQYNGTIIGHYGKYSEIHDSDDRSFEIKSQQLSQDIPLGYELPEDSTFWHRIHYFFALITWPVRLCLGLLFCKVFTIETLVSATSALSKNRYGWQVNQVGTLGFIIGCLVIPFSILVGRLSMSHQDHVLMLWLVGTGCLGMFLLIDLSDLVETQDRHYNEGHPLAVGPNRYICGYFLSYLSIQSFEGVIGSTLSKVIPTALASGTINSGLLATMVDTFGRACGDLFISAVGFVNLRQLTNLLFIPGFAIMLICFVVIERFRDLLSV